MLAGVRRSARNHSSSPPSRLECKDCGRTYATSATLERHQKSHSNEHGNMQTCDKSYTDDVSQFSMLSGQKGEKGKDVTDVKAEAGEPIPQEEEDLGVGPPNIMAQFLKDHEVLPSVSVPTGEAPSRRTSRTRSAPESENVSCEFCGKVFTKKNNLKRHRRLHTGERPFRCHLCHKAFSRSDTLKYHLSTHSALGRRGTFSMMTPSPMAMNMFMTGGATSPSPMSIPSTSSSSNLAQNMSGFPFPMNIGMMPLNMPPLPPMNMSMPFPMGMGNPSQISGLTQLPQLPQMPHISSSASSPISVSPALESQEASSHGSVSPNNISNDGIADGAPASEDSGGPTIEPCRPPMPFPVDDKHYEQKEVPLMPPVTISLPTGSLVLPGNEKSAFFPTNHQSNPFGNMEHTGAADMKIDSER